LYESEQKPEEYKKMVRPGFEPGISDSKGGVASQDTRLQIPTVALPSTTSAVDWDKYKEYLYANQRPNTARLALKYGKKYSYVLERMDIKGLLILPHAKQRHIMKPLANLAKYNGLYEQMNSLQRQHMLKWLSTDTLDIFDYSNRLDSFIVQPDDSHLSPEKSITEVVV
jgi:hypothetical protein